MPNYSNNKMNFQYDHEWVLEWSKMLDFRQTVGSGKSNSMQVSRALICTDETLVTSICTSNPVLKIDSTYSLSNHKLRIKEYMALKMALKIRSSTYQFLFVFCKSHSCIPISPRFERSWLPSPSPPRGMKWKSSSKDELPFFLVLLLLTDYKPN